jgi:hypothetical protein
MGLWGFSSVHSYLQHKIEVPGHLHDPAFMWVTACKQCNQLTQIQRHVSACRGKPKLVAVFVPAGNTVHVPGSLSPVPILVKDCVGPIAGLECEYAC